LNRLFGADCFNSTITNEQNTTKHSNTICGMNILPFVQIRGSSDKRLPDSVPSGLQAQNPPSVTEGDRIYNTTPLGVPGSPERNSIRAGGFNHRWCESGDLSPEGTP
jgi:hypothetical protein